MISIQYSLALQPFTPVLPIRGGKLKATKPFSSSNPQLPFTCVPSSNSINSSKNSIFGSSVIWREASPNNFHIYSASISSLNTSYRSRNSIMDCYNTATGTKTYWRNRAASEERPTTIKAFETNNTSAGTPLLGRKVKQVKIKKFSTNLQAMNQVHQQQPLTDAHPGLYDRKLNRSFEKPETGFVRKVDGAYPEDYYVGTSAGSRPNINNNSSSPLRRSTPHLAADEYLDPDFRNSIAPASWCCGVMKQLRKMNLQY